MIDLNRACGSLNADAYRFHLNLLNVIDLTEMIATG